MMSARAHLEVGLSDIAPSVIEEKLSRMAGRLVRTVKLPSATLALYYLKNV